jgi:hypothetical protein
MFSRFLSEDYSCSCYIGRLRHVRSDAKDHTSGDPSKNRVDGKHCGNGGRLTQNTCAVARPESLLEAEGGVD